ncbi:monooxygenase, partial [Paracidovorax cattleyae]
MSLATMPAHDPAADGGDAATAVAGDGPDRPIAPPAPEAVAQRLGQQFAR